MKLRIVTANLWYGRAHPDALSELIEIERVVRSGGVALHLGFPHPPSPDDPLDGQLAETGHAVVTYAEGQERRTAYRKQI